MCLAIRTSSKGLNGSLYLFTTSIMIMYSTDNKKSVKHLKIKAHLYH